MLGRTLKHTIDTWTDNREERDPLDAYVRDCKSTTNWPIPCQTKCKIKRARY